MFEFFAFFLILPIVGWFVFGLMWLGRSRAYRGPNPAEVAGCALAPGCLLLVIVALLIAVASCAAGADTGSS